MNIGSFKSPFSGQTLGNAGMHSISQMMGNQGLVGPLGAGGIGGGSHQSRVQISEKALTISSAFLLSSLIFAKTFSTLYYCCDDVKGRI